MGDCKVMAALAVMKAADTGDFDDLLHAALRMKVAIQVGRSEQANRVPIDVYGQAIQQPSGLKPMVHFTTAEFNELLVECQVHLQRRRVRSSFSANPLHSDIVRPSKMTLQNRLLLTLLWLAKNKTFDDLGQQFGISKSTVSEEIHHGIYALHDTLDEIHFPTPEQRELLRALHRHMKECFGSVDTTAIRISRPSATPAAYWSRHHHMYCTKVQVVTVPPLNIIVSIDAGFPGSVQDKTAYESTAVATMLQPTDRLLADSAYRGTPSLIARPIRILNANSETD